MGTLKVHQITVKRLLLYDLKCHQITRTRLVMFILIYLAIVGCVSSACQNQVKNAFILSSSDSFITCLSAWRISHFYLVALWAALNSRSLFILVNGVMRIRLKLWKIIRWWFHQQNPQNVAIFQNLNHNWKVNSIDTFLIPTYWYSCAHINEYTKHACARTFRNDIIPNLKSRLSIKKLVKLDVKSFHSRFFAPPLNNTNKHVIDKYFVKLIAKCFR